MSEFEEHAFIQLGGRRYPRHHTPSCHTCTSPNRAEIEQALLHGYGYRAISESQPASDPVSAQSIASHYKNGHMALTESVQRSMVEERAKEMGLDIEGEPTLVDHVTLARLGVQRVYERLADGTLDPDVKDGIAFANLLMKSGMFEGSDIDQQAMVEAFGAYMEAAEAVMTEEQMNRFAQHLSGHPVLRALHSREAKAGLEASSDIVDAEILDDEPAR